MYLLLFTDVRDTDISGKMYFCSSRQGLKEGSIVQAKLGQWGYPRDQLTYVSFEGRQQPDRESITIYKHRSYIWIQVVCVRMQN